MMSVGIIGAGFTGLAAAYWLARAGYKVEVFEKENHPGGLAAGFRSRKWIEEYTTRGDFVVDRRFSIRKVYWRQ